MGGPNCFSPKVSNSVVRKKERCTPLLRSISMSDVSCISHVSPAKGAATGFSTMLPLTSAQDTDCPLGQTCSLHDLHTAARLWSVSLSPEAVKNPAVNFHLVRTRIFLMHIVGHDQGLYHRLAVSLRRIFSLVHRARCVFVIAPHGDFAWARFMFTASTARRTAPPGAGFVCSHRFPFPH